MRPDRLELRGEQRLVDLAVVDRDALLEADPDHVFTIDAGLLRQLVRRQVVCHLAPSSSVSLKHEKARRARGAGGLGSKSSWHRTGSFTRLPLSLHKLISVTQ